MNVCCGVYPDASRQYNDDMYKLVVFLVMVGVAWASMLLAAEEPPPHVPGFNERLNQVLGSEGGVQVYKDPEGNVGTILDPPGGTRRVTVQPPQNPSINLGPPLQLHNPPSQLPPAVPPPQPSAPNVPQRAH
jgi:hypothetical protein